MNRSRKISSSSESGDDREDVGQSTSHKGNDDKKFTVNVAVDADNNLPPFSGCAMQFHKVAIKTTESFLAESETEVHTLCLNTYVSEPMLQKLLHQPTEQRRNNNNKIKCQFDLTSHSNEPCGFETGNICHFKSHLMQHSGIAFICPEPNCNVDAAFYELARHWKNGLHRKNTSAKSHKIHHKGFGVKVDESQSTLEGKLKNTLIGAKRDLSEKVKFAINFYKDRNIEVCGIKIGVTMDFNTRYRNHYKAKFPPISKYATQPHADHNLCVLYTGPMKYCVEVEWRLIYGFYLVKILSTKGANFKPDILKVSNMMLNEHCTKFPIEKSKEMEEGCVYVNYYDIKYTNERNETQLHNKYKSDPINKFDN